ncbi:MAG: zinc-ribbon domain-containing protein [Lachnospiraceae bacterium]|nr:zinc-ribbon domain-containing protein [Lachnospiraceae bacterium]
MFCQNCGSEVTEGKRFCGNCGAPVGNANTAAPAGNAIQNAPVQPVRPVNSAGGTPPKKQSKTWLIILIIVGAVLALSIIAVAVVTHFVRKAANEYRDRIEDKQYEEIEDIEDLDLDSLNEAVDALEDLDLNADFDLDEPDYDEPEKPAVGEGDFTQYSYADVTTNGTDITVVPNGGLSGSTRLFKGNDKDLNGFLDYVDSDVLEEGRVINREFLYGMLACMLVDKDLISDKDSIERNMIMALAMANNFYSMDVKINECDLDANNADVYRYKVTAYGDKDDIWVVNYNESTVFFNDGGTEYHSTMFENQYLAMWMIAIEEYYGLN